MVYMLFNFSSRFLNSNRFYQTENVIVDLVKHGKYLPWIYYRHLMFRAFMFRLMVHNETCCCSAQLHFTNCNARILNFSINVSYNTR